MTTCAPRPASVRAAARPIPLAPPVINAMRPASSSGRRRLRELVTLERPVLDCERLCLAERAEPAQGVGGAFDGDRPVVQIARDTRAPAIGAGRDDADSRDENHARAGRIDRKLSCLVVQIALVVAAIPVRELLDPSAERGGELRRAVVRGIEVDDQRPVLRVDQVVGAGRADLTDLGRSHR